jgi:hypothetical protein
MKEAANRTKTKIRPEPRGVLRSSPVLYSAQIQCRSRVITWLEGVLLLLEGRGRLEEAARVLLLLEGRLEEVARVLLLLNGGPEEAVGKHLPTGGCSCMGEEEGRERRSGS